jgi:hypothetical protein
MISPDNNTKKLLKFSSYILTILGALSMIILAFNIYVHFKSSSLYVFLSFFVCSAVLFSTGFISLVLFNSLKNRRF